MSRLASLPAPKLPLLIDSAGQAKEQVPRSPNGVSLQPLIGGWISLLVQNSSCHIVRFFHDLCRLFLEVVFVVRVI